MGPGRQLFQDGSEGSGQAPQQTERFAIVLQLLPIRQMPVNEQKGYFLKDGLCRQVFNGITAIRQSHAFFAHCADVCFAGNDSG